MKHTKKATLFYFFAFLLVANVLSALWPAERVSVVRDTGGKSEAVIMERHDSLVETVVDAYINAKIAEWVHRDSVAAAKSDRSEKGKGSV